MFKLYIVIVLAVMTAQFLGSLLSYLINSLLDKLIFKALIRKKHIELFTKNTEDIVDEVLKDFPKPGPSHIDYSKPYSDNKPNS